jgi:hypothetical protein
VSLVIIVVFLLCGVLSVVFLNRALRRGPSLFLIPFYYVLSLLFTILGGLIYFHEFRAFFYKGNLFQLETCLQFCAGVAVTIAGVFLGSGADAEMLSTEEEGTDEAAATGSGSAITPDPAAKEQMRQWLAEQDKSSAGQGIFSERSSSTTPQISGPSAWHEYMHRTASEPQRSDRSEAKQTQQLLSAVESRSATSRGRERADSEKQALLPKRMSAPAYGAHDLLSRASRDDDALDEPVTVMSTELPSRSLASVDDSAADDMSDERRRLLPVRGGSLKGSHARSEADMSLIFLAAPRDRNTHRSMDMSYRRLFVKPKRIYRRVSVAALVGFGVA